MLRKRTNWLCNFHNISVNMIIIFIQNTIITTFLVNLVITFGSRTRIWKDVSRCDRVGILFEYSSSCRLFQPGDKSSRLIAIQLIWTNPSMLITIQLYWTKNHVFRGQRTWCSKNLEEQLLLKCKWHVGTNENAWKFYQ